jgi:tetratricopeptide (TPR) repeat protein/tRNA A-37 threonylcarbamoyl transferase component Bud32
MIGQTISHYKILEAIGEGGMGVVYLAEDLTLKRRVALKFPSQRAFSRSDELARFIHEARAAASLDHPNICTIHEIAEFDGRTFIAMGYVEGETVKHKVESGPLPLDDALAIAIQTAEGLGAAHDKGIIHRDVKSANIIVTGHGQVKIMDFGLAKLPGQTRLTKTGTTVGTIAYMSPEQAKGEAVDARADVFSLGVVFYEMLTGALPFAGEHEAAVIYSIINVDPKPLADHGVSYPEGVQHVLDKALEKDPEDRFQSAGELLEALSNLREGLAPRLATRRTRTNRLVRAVGVVMAAVLLMAVGYGAISRLVPRHGGELPAIAQTLEPFVVAVAPFWGHSAEAAEDGKVMQTLVARRIDDVLGREESVRLLADATFEAPRFHSDARAMGDALGATVVVWGEVLELRGEVEIQPYVTVIKPVVQIRDESVDALEIALAEPEQLSLRKAKADETGDMALLVAASYYRHRDADRSLSLLGQIEPPTAECLRQQGNIYYDRKDYAQAERFYKEAIKQSPDDAAPHINLSCCYLAQLKYDEAIAAAQKAYDLDPTAPAALLNLGWGCVRTGKYEEAITHFTKLIELDPKDARAHDGLGWTYQQQKQWEPAEAEYRKAIELDAKYANPHNNLGWAYYQQKRVDEALAEYETAIELDSTLAWPYNNLGWHYYQTGDVERAIPLFEKATSLGPELKKPRANLLFANYRLGRMDEALAAARGILSVDSTFVNAYNIMGAIYSDRGEYDQAIAAMERSIALRPESATLISNLAKIYQAAGRWEDALVLNKRAIGLAPDNAELCFDLGVTYQRMGDYVRAAEAFQRAMNISEEDPYYHVYYYLNVYRTGDVERARDHIKGVAERFPPGEVITNMIRFYAGQVAEDSVLAAASAEDERQDRERKCEAYYYLGIAHLIGVDSTGMNMSKAREYFEKCLATETEIFLEYRLAEAELAAIDKVGLDRLPD